MGTERMEYYANGRPASGRSSRTNTSEYSEHDYIHWVNRNLAHISPPLNITDITDSYMCNGVAIGLLLEIVGNLKLSGLLLQPGTRVERLHNVHEVFTMLRRLNVRLDNVQPEDMMNGDRETILQVVHAIASHFSRHQRGRSSTSPEMKFSSRAFSGSPSPHSSRRQTPIERYSSSICSTPSVTMQSEHYTELTNARYSHEIIGPNVYSENHSGKSSPRSRSSMTMMFSGQRSPTTTRRPGSRSSDGSETVAPKPRTPRDRVDHRGMNNHANTMPVASAAELPHYLESMNELSNLKSQLNTISKLIASDTGSTNTDVHGAFYPAKTMQTDTQRDIYRDLKHAQQQIAELTRIVHTKEQTLRHIENENARLRETIRTLQEALYQQEAGNHFSSGGRRTPAAAASGLRSPDRHRSPTGTTHDPRVSDFPGQIEQPKKRSRSRDRVRSTSPGRSAGWSRRSDGHHVKRMTFDLDPRQPEGYVEESRYPVQRAILKHTN